MDLLFIIKKIISLFLFPIVTLSLLGFLGLYLQKKCKQTGNIMITLSLLLFFVLSFPVTGNLFLYLVQGKPYNPLLKAYNSQEYKAIIILGGGPKINETVYSRLELGADLHKNTQIPILVTEGKIFKNKPSGAEFMKKILEKNFNVSVKWVEDKALDTYQNALFSYNLLNKPDKKIILVTDASHIDRAEKIFKKVGFKVEPAPSLFITEIFPKEMSYWVPNGRGYRGVAYALHEFVGRLYYKIMY